MATLAVRRDKLHERCRAAGINSDYQLARRIGLHHGQVSRVLSGKSAPGPKFIGSICDLFGKESFPDLFDVVP